jgi:hypothetical protein
LFPLLRFLTGKACPDLWRSVFTVSITRVFICFSPSINYTLHGICSYIYVYTAQRDNCIHNMPRFSWNIFHVMCSCIYV